MLGKLLAAGVAFAALSPSASADCPEDWKEGLLMAVTGGIYCQFDEARDLINEGKARIAQIHAEGQAELDALKRDYENRGNAQEKAAADEIVRMVKRLRALADGPRLDFRVVAAATVVAPAPAPAPAPAGRSGARAGAAAGVVGGRAPLPPAVAAGSRVVGSPPQGGISAAEQERLNRAKDEAAKEAAQVNPCATISAGVSGMMQPTQGMLPAQRQQYLSGMIQGGNSGKLGSMAKFELCAAATRGEQERDGTLEQIGAELDKLIADFKRDLDEGYATNLFTPLAGILAGIPPPDPIVLFAMWGTTQLRIAETLRDKNAFVEAARKRYDDKLAGEKDALDDTVRRVKEELDRAEGIASTADAWEKSQTDKTTADLAGAIGMPPPGPAKPFDPAAARVSTAAPVGGVSAGAVYDSSRLQVILDSANQAVLKPIAPRPTSAKLALITAGAPKSVSKADGQSVIAMAKEALAADPQALAKVEGWVNTHTN